jgi:predicted AAA+ superfamily ATPase
MERITQSLAGRVGLLTLLPISNAELDDTHLRPTSYEDFARNGGYPRLYDRSIPPGTFYSAYITTYIERDIRSMRDVGDLSAFHRFVKLCAARAGQLLNLQNLAADCGIAINTAKSWLSVLEASYILFLLRPHHANFSKRLIKTPKLYFYDTGVLCHLLGITSNKTLYNHHLCGAIFENMTILEIVKYYTNTGQNSEIFFWRDSNGNEIDVLLETGGRLSPIEIKSSATMQPAFAAGLKKWLAIAGDAAGQGFVVYDGDIEQYSGDMGVVNWRNIGKALAQLP